MSLEDNKNVVRRFITEVLAKGDISVVDQLVGPEYRNLAFPTAGVEAFKQFIGMTDSAISG